MDDDDDTRRLAAPVDKRTSVVKMLKRQLAREKRAAKRASQGSTEGASNDLASGSEGIELPELRQRPQGEDRTGITRDWRNYGSTGQSDSEDSPHRRPQASTSRPSEDMADSEPRQAPLSVQFAHEPWTIRDNNTYFVYGPSFRGSNQPESSSGQQRSWSVREWWDEMWGPYGGFHRLTSVWIYVSLSLLLVANCFNLAAFVTNNWGILIVNRPHVNVSRVTGPQTRAVGHVNDTSSLRWIRDTWREFSDEISKDLGYDSPSREQRELPRADGYVRHVVNQMNIPDEPTYWRFGLWQCCRNTDGLCLGIRWTVSYNVSRAFSVLALFGMILSFAWMLGHTLEKLLDYDVCTMSCLISLNYATSLFSFINVVLFGIRWPVDFKNEFNGTDPRLSFSFYLAAFTVPMTLAAAICSTIDLKRETAKMKLRNSEDYYTDTDLAYIDQDIPTDNISRPRETKKKRAAQATRGRYTPTGSSVV